MLPPRSKMPAVWAITPSFAAASSARYGTSMSMIAWSQNVAVPHDALSADRLPVRSGVTCVTFGPAVTRPPLPGWTVMVVFVYC